MVHSRSDVSILVIDTFLSVSCGEVAEWDIDAIGESVGTDPMGSLLDGHEGPDHHKQILPFV